MVQQRVSFPIARRRLRPLALLALWLALVLLAFLCSPRPRIAPRPADGGTELLSEAFDLSAEPTLLVFRRLEGLTPTDWAYVRQAVRDLSGRLSYSDDDSDGVVAVLSLNAAAADILALRTAAQGAPAGLEIYVTGVAALAHDAGTSWLRARYVILVGVAVIAGLVALFGRLGLRRALIVGTSAGCVGGMASAANALVASPLAVALSTVVSAGLAGAWAVRLFSPRCLERAAISSPADGHRASMGPSVDSMSVSKITPLQNAIVQAGEGSLLQALVIAAGCAGFLSAWQAGAALILGLVVAVAFSLSGTPALIALFARPRRPRTVGGERNRRWLRLGLALIPVAGIICLAPSAHPLGTVSPGMESAVGYRLLMEANDAGRGTSIVGQVMPFHLLIRSLGGARSEAGLMALRNLVVELNARPGVASVEGEEALRASPAAGEEQPDSLEQQIASLDRLEVLAGGLADELEAQVGALALVADDLERLRIEPSATPTANSVKLEAVGERLAEISDRLSEADAALSRVPTEFPEVAPRMRDVPALEALPDALDVAVADLDEVAVDLTRVAELRRPEDALRDGRLRAIQADLARSTASLETLTADAVGLRDELAAAETIWAGAALGDSTPATSNPYLVSHDLIRLALVPSGDPYAPATLDLAPALMRIAQETLADGPLDGSELTLSGAPAVAAAQRTRALRQWLAPGLVVATLAVALFAWGALSRASVAFRLAIGAVLSGLVGVGVAAVAFRPLDVGVIALVGVALVAVVGGRMAAGYASPVEALTLTLPCFCLTLTGIVVLRAAGVALGGGLLVGHFLVAPALGHGSDFGQMEG